MEVKLKWMLKLVMLYILTSKKVGARAFGHATSGEGASVPYCGVSATQNLKAFRIVGGADADPYEFPWMGKLLYDGSLTCAASLIADRYLVTAGHCVTEHKSGLNSNHFTVVLGSHRTEESGAVGKRVRKIIIHPDYDVFASGNEDVGKYVIQTNDIAILKITTVIFSAKISPVCLPPQGVRVKNNMQMVLAGWGSISPDDMSGTHKAKLPLVLQKTTLKQISFAECQSNKHVGLHLDEVNQLTEREIFCMVGNNTDSCQGDSGGPVVEKTHHGYRLVGLVSWGIGCNQDAIPAVYTQVSSYIDFLVAHTKAGKFLPYKH